MQVHRQIVSPQSTAFTERRRLGRLHVREPQARQIPIGLGKLPKLANDVS